MWERLRREKKVDVENKQYWADVIEIARVVEEKATKRRWSMPFLRLSERTERQKMTSDK